MLRIEILFDTPTPDLSVLLPPGTLPPIPRAEQRDQSEGRKKLFSSC